MTKTLLLLLVSALSGLLASETVQAQTAARAVFVNGAVMTTGADGAQRPLLKNGELRRGDLVVTNEGRVQLNFTDGGIVFLQPKSEFRIDEYSFVDATPNKELGIFSLLKGALRTITGKIGRTEKRAYRMDTVVATIGIRGTEYSARLDNGLTASTAAGEIEVCNNGGCTIVRKGESVFAPDSNSKPGYTNVQAGQSPAAPPPTNVNLFVGGDLTTATGGIPIPTVPSGPGYSVVYAGFDVSIPPPLEFTLPAVTGTATFDQAGGLSSFDRGTSVDAATAQAEAMTDGTIAWGRWAGGTVDGLPVANTHYVVGLPTPASALAGLETTNFQGLGPGKAVYNFMGATQPTAANGTIGGGVSGSLTVQFAGGTANVATLLNVPIGGGTYAITNSGMTGTFPAFSAGATVACSGNCGSAGTTAQINGSFVGSNAARAGLTYTFTGAGALGGVTGAAAFAR